jgi:hypothetical protein
MRSLIVLGILVLFAVPAHAQLGGTVGAGAGIGNSGGLAKASFPSMRANPVTQFRVTVASGSDSTFAPSDFMPYEAALAAGSADPVRSMFLNYREAIAEGIAERAARPKSIADVARENRKQKRSVAYAVFVQDQLGHVVKQSD